MLGALIRWLKIAIIKTLRRLNTTWNFARSITRVLTHEHKHWEHCCVHRVVWKRRFFNSIHVSCCISRVRPSWQAKSVDPRVRPSGRRVMVGRSSSLVPYECTDNSFFLSWAKSNIDVRVEKGASYYKQYYNSLKSHMTSRMDICCRKPVSYRWPERVIQGEESREMFIRPRVVTAVIRPKGGYFDQYKIIFWFVCFSVDYINPYVFLHSLDNFRIEKIKKQYWIRWCVQTVDWLCIFKD